MFKSLFVLVALLVLPALSYGWCFGDGCDVQKPYEASVGINITVDFDVCLDTPSQFCGYDGCQQAVVVQTGSNNYGYIDQTGKSFAMVWQEGTHNTGYITQNANNSTALSIQKGERNFSSIFQTASGANASVVQLGTANTGYIYQK